jgi:hypothetical protein
MDGKTLNKEQLDELTEWLTVRLIYDRDMQAVSIDTVLGIMDEYKVLYTKLINNEHE